MRLAAACLLALAARAAQAAPQVVATQSLGGPQHGLVQPQALVFDDARRELWVSGQDQAAGRLVVVDAASGQPVASIAGLAASALALDPALGRIYAASYTRIRAIDATSRVVQATFTVTGCNPRALALDGPSGDLIVLCDIWDATIQKTRQEFARLNKAGAKLASYALPVGAAYGVTGDALQARAGRVYAALMRSQAGTSTPRGELWVFDGALLSPLQTLVLPGAYPAGLAYVNGSLWVGDMTGRLSQLSPAADGLWSVTGSQLIGAGIWNVAADPSSPLLFAVGYADNQVHVWNTATNAHVAAVQAGKNPVAAAVDKAGGKLWVANRLSSDLTGVDLADPTRPPVMIALRLRRAFDIALDPAGGRGFVTSGLAAGGLLPFDFAAGKAGAPLQFGYDTPQNAAVFPTLGKLFYSTPGAVRRVTLASGASSMPHQLYYATGLAALEGSTKLLVTLNRSRVAPVDRSLLVLFDAQAETVVRQVDIGPSTASPKAAAHSFAYGKAYVPLMAAGTLAVVDVEGGALLKTLVVGKSPVAAAIDDGLAKVFVANSAANTVSVVDLRTDAVLATLPVGRQPQAVAVKARGHRVYVANATDKTLTVLSALTHQAVATLALGGTPVSVRVDPIADRVYVTLREDGRVAIIDDPFVGDSQPPQLLHTPVTGPVPENEPVWIRATATDDLGVASVRLTYWDSAGGALDTVGMKRASGSLYEAQIPASFLCSLFGNEISYYIDATDAEGNGPPTGATPGTPAAPNRLRVARTLSAAWRYEFGQVFGGFYRMIPGPSAAVGELRPDAAGLEVATGNEEWQPLGDGPTDPLGRWFLFDARGQVLFWKDTENDEAHSSVLLHDLDGDGTPEMLGGTTSGNQVQAITAAGQWRWRYFLGGHHLATPAADVLVSGQPPTVFSGAFDSYLRAIDGSTGKLKWSFQAQSWIWSSPAVGDIDGDGAKEVVFGSDEGMFYALSASSPALKWKLALGGLEDHIRASPALADLDADGRLEVLIGAPTGVFHCLDGKTGAKRWSFTTGGEILSSAAVGDVDGDSKPEVVFGSADGFLYALRPDGSLRWKAALGSAVYGSPALARRNPGAALDVYVTTLGGSLFIVRGTDGATLGGFNAGAEVVSSPVAADVDGDGKLEVFFQDRKGDQNETMAGDLFWAVRDLGSSVAPFAREWPMFRSNPAHTGVYAGAGSAAPPGPPQDKLAPVSAILTPAAGGFQTDPLPVSGTAADIGSGLAAVNVLLRESGSPATLTLAASGTGYWSLALGSAPFTEGRAYELRSQAVDLAGNQEQPGAGVSFVYDGLPPAVWFAAPAVAAGSSGPLVAISGTATDATSGVGKVMVSVVGPDLQPVLPWTLAAGTGAWTWQGKVSLARGVQYVAHAFAQDLVLRAREMVRPFSYELTAPAGLALAALPEGGSFRLTWQANPEPDVAGYRVYRDGKLLASTTSPWRLDSGLADGVAYAYSVSALDTAGHEGPQSAPVSGVPLPPPSVRLLLPKDGATVAGFATITATTTGTIGSVAYTLDGAGYLTGAIITPPFTLYWDTTKFPNGPHELTAGGWDKKTGKWLADSPAVTVTIDNPVPPPAIPIPAPVLEPGPPTVRILTPAYGSVLSATVTLTAESTGDIGCVAYTLDGKGYLNACLMAAPYAFAFDTTKVMPGTHTLTAGGWDKATGAFLVGSPPVVFGIAKPAPSKATGLAITAPEEGAALRLTWNANPEPDVADFNVYRDGKLLAATTNLWLLDGGLLNGTTYTYQVAALAGGLEGPRSAPVAGVPQDRIAPVSAILAPAGGGYRTGAVAASGTASDAGSGLAEVRLLVRRRDQAESSVLSASGTAAWTLLLSSAALADGHAYELRSQAVDRAGNLEQPGPGVSFVFDGLPPAVSLAAPALEAALDDPLVTLSGAAADTASGVSSVSVRVAAADGKDLLAWTVAAGTGAWQWRGKLPLSRGANYIAQARAVDGAGRSAQAQLEFAYAELSAPAGLALEAPAAGGALRLSWKANSEPDVTGYRVYRDGKLLSGASSLWLLDGGLTNATTYTYQVSAQGAGEGPKCSPVSGVPQDLLPPASALSSPADGTRLSTTTLLVSGAASDPGTAGLALVDVGLAEGDGSFAWLRASGTETFSALLAGLQDGKIYRVASRATDRAGNVEAPAAFRQVKVDFPPSPVAGLKAKLVSADTVRLTWTASPVQDLAGYRVYRADGLLAGQTKETSLLILGLAGGQAYQFLVAAVDQAGQEGARASVEIAVPLGGQARAWIRVPKEGKKLWGNAVTVIADTEGPVDRVLFEFRHQNETAWTAITSADSKPPYAVYWNISDARVSTGSYRLRAVAFDAMGLPDAAPAETRVVLDDANADLVEDGNPDVDPNNAHRKEEKIDSSTQTQTVELADGTRVVVPAGAVPAGETLVVTVIPPEAAPKPVAKTTALEPVGVFREFTFTGGTKEFQQELTLTLPVPDADGDGICDGTDIRVEDLRVYYYSEKEGVWLPVNGAGATAMAASAGGAAGPTFKTSHFTLFGLFAEKKVAAAPTLGQSYVFPNPATAGKNPTFHIESGPARRMELRVYDFSGQLVYSAAVEGAPNVIDGHFAYRHAWQAAGAASGVYLYVVDVYGDNDAKSSASGKFALVR